MTSEPTPADKAEADLAELSPDLAEEVKGWREKIKAHQPIVFELHWPIVLASEKIERLTFRPLTSRDMKHFPVDRKQMTHGDYLVAAANSCGQAPPVMELMAAEDFGRVVMIVELFWQGSPKTGKSSSAT